MSGRQTRPGKMRDNNTLQEQFHPPDSGHKQPFRPPQTKTPSQNTSALPIQDTSNHSALPRHQHPPKTKREVAGKLLNH